MANLCKETYVDFTQEMLPSVKTAAALGVPIADDNGVSSFHLNGRYFEWINQGQNDDVVPVKSAATPLGWGFPGDNTANDSIEISQGVDADAVQTFFTVGTSPAFELSVKLVVPDVSDYDVCFVGFRQAAAYVDAVAAAAELSDATGYANIVGLNLNAGDMETLTGAAKGTSTLTDSTDNVTNGTAVTMTTKVSAAGVVTFLIDGAAPTVNTNTITLPSTTVMIPTIILVKGGNASDTPPVLQTYWCGYQ